MKFTLGNETYKKAYLLADKSVYKYTQSEELEKVEHSQFKSASFPLLIIGLEHCSFVSKEYPITDKSDLKEIVDLEFGEDTFVEQIQYQEQKSVVRAWKLDNYAKSLVDDKWMYWLPEGWLLDNVEQGALYKVQRAERTLWLASRGGQTYSSFCEGVFANKDYFLISAGVSHELEPQLVGQHEYCKVIRKQLLTMSANRLFSPFSAQGYKNKLALLCNWPTVAVGCVAGFILFAALHIGILNLRLGMIDDKSALKDVVQVRTIEKDYETKKASLEKLRSALAGNSPQSQSWSVLASLMESEVTILRVKQTDETLEVRAETKLATAALQMLTELPAVQSAEFITPVRKSVGKERFTVLIALAGQGNANG